MSLFSPQHPTAKPFPATRNSLRWKRPRYALPRDPSPRLRLISARDFPLLPLTPWPIPLGADNCSHRPSPKQDRPTVNSLGVLCVYTCMYTVLRQSGRLNPRVVRQWAGMPPAGQQCFSSRRLSSCTAQVLCATSGRWVSVSLWREHVAAIEGRLPSGLLAVWTWPVVGGGGKPWPGSLVWSPHLRARGTAAALFFPASSNFGSRFPILTGCPVGQNPTVEHS